MTGFAREPVTTRRAEPFASTLPRTVFRSTSLILARRKGPACRSQTATSPGSCSNTLAATARRLKSGNRSASFAGRCGSVSGWRVFFPVISGPYSLCAVPITRFRLADYLSVSGSRRRSFVVTLIRMMRLSNPQWAALGVGGDLGFRPTSRTMRQAEWPRGGHVRPAGWMCKTEQGKAALPRGWWERIGIVIGNLAFN